MTRRPTTTAASSSSAPTVTSTPGSGTAARSRTPRTTRRTSTACSGSSCGSTRCRRAATPRRRAIPYVDRGRSGRDLRDRAPQPLALLLRFVNGALTIGDVGGSALEEIDYVTGPNAGLGANFGWNDYEGFDETAFGIGANASPHTEPIADFTHGDPDNFCSIAGGYVVHDPGLPAIEGSYVFSDLCANEIFVAGVPSGTSSELGVSTGTPVSFGEGENGQIYVVDLGGDVFRLEQNV